MSDVLIVIPCFNEKNRLTDSANRVDSFLRKNNLDYKIVISNNCSTDGTEGMAKDLCKKLGFIYHEVNEPGKGACVRNTWIKFDSKVYAFMDADISTDLEVLPRMEREIDRGYDLVVGSRYLPDSKSKRIIGRKLASLTYIKTFNSFSGKETSFTLLELSLASST